LARLVVEMTGSRSDLRYLDYNQAYPAGFEDMRRRVPSVEKLERVLGWAPRRPLEDNLSRIISHLRTARSAAERSPVPA